MAQFFEVIVGPTSCLAIMDEGGSGLRICGGKQSGGG